MWSKRQSLLIDQLCEASNLQNSATRVKEQCALLVDEVAISLLPGRADESICVIVQLGQPARHLELLAYKKLLELNLVIDQGNHQRMAIDLRHDVHEAQGVLVFVDLEAGDLAAQDLGEDVVRVVRHGGLSAVGVAETEGRALRPCRPRW